MMIDFKAYRGVIFDLDGVIYRGEEIMPGAKDLVANLLDEQKKLLFLTNNSSKTADQIIEKFERIGISNIKPDQILSSAIATGEWLKRNATAGSRVFVFGGDGIKEQVKVNGFTLVDDETADFVVSGLNMHLTYEELTRATLNIQKGAQLIATNQDLSYPTERGLQPGAGSLLAVLTLSSGQQPVAVLGKPSPDIFHLALAKLGISSKECLMVGDRLDTDILGANQVGMDTALVLTGVSNKADIETTKIQPKFVIEDLLSFN